jgi:hypothetical protein
MEGIAGGGDSGLLEKRLIVANAQIPNRLARHRSFSQLGRWYPAGEHWKLDDGSHPSVMNAKTGHCTEHPLATDCSRLNALAVPHHHESGDDHNVYLVMDDLGRLGRVWCEADDSAAELEAVILDLLAGQYKSPIRVVTFNTVERFRRRRPGAAPALRSAAARHSLLPAGFR